MWRGFSPARKVFHHECFRRQDATGHCGRDDPVVMVGDRGFATDA